MDETQAASDGPGISRRSALKKGAMIGTAAFVIPAVTTMSMDKAFAQPASGGPTGPPRPGGPPLGGPPPPPGPPGGPPGPPGPGGPLGPH